MFQKFLENQNKSNEEATKQEMKKLLKQLFIRIKILGEKMSNQYIEAICTMPKEIAFGYDPYDNLSFTQKAKVKAGVVRPESTAEYRWHYAKAAASEVAKQNVGAPSNLRIISIFNKVNGAWTQFSCRQHQTSRYGIKLDWLFRLLRLNSENQNLLCRHDLW